MAWHFAPSGAPSQITRAINGALIVHRHMPERRLGPGPVLVAAAPEAALVTKERALPEAPV